MCPDERNGLHIPQPASSCILEVIGPTQTGEQGKESEPPSLAEAMEACLEETCLEEAAGLPETSDARPQEADLVTEIGSAERGLAVEPPKVVVRRGK